MATRDDIALGAGPVLATRPRATMEEIARAAGVSRATLFRHFPSREALVVELCTRAAELYVQTVDEAAPEDGTASAALRRLLEGLATLAPAHGLLVLQTLPDVVEARLLERVAVADRRLHAVVRRGQDAGEFRTDLSAEWVLIAATWLVVGAADGLRLGVLAPRDIERLVVETLLGALRRENAAR